MVFRARRGRRNVTLNVTSLIDVLFLLLIFFMLIFMKVQPLLSL